MRILRLSVLVVCVAAAVCGGFGAEARAQGAADAQNSLPDFLTPHDSRDVVPTRFKQRDAAKRFQLWTAGAGKPVYLAAPTARQLHLLAEAKGPCYTMRTYKFDSADADSGLTPLTGVTNCQRAKTALRKEIVVLPALPEPIR